MRWETRMAGRKSALIRVAAASTSNPVTQRSQTIFPPNKSWRPAWPSTTRVPTAMVTKPRPAAKNKCSEPTRANGQKAAQAQPAARLWSAQRTALPGVVESFHLLQDRRLQGEPREDYPGAQQVARGRLAGHLQREAGGDEQPGGDGGEHPRPPSGGRLGRVVERMGAGHAEKPW